MSLHENSGFRSQWLRHVGLLVVVARGPGRRSLVSSSNFENLVLGGLEHTLICLAGSVTSLYSFGQCISAVVKVPGSFRQFAKSSLFRVRLNRNVHSTRRSQALAPFKTLAVSFSSWSLPMLCLRTDRSSKS